MDIRTDTILPQITRCTDARVSKTTYQVASRFLIMGRKKVVIDSRCREVIPVKPQGKKNKREVITMDNNKAVAVKREWVEVALNIIRFFFQHSTFEYDGMNRKARVKYHGPNGWNVSVDTSFNLEERIDGQAEVLEQWQD